MTLLPADDQPTLPLESPASEPAAAPAIEHADALPRGAAEQMARRTAEHTARQNAVEVCHRMQAQGHTQAETAASLGMKARTLGHWYRQQQAGQLQIHLRGRPVTCATPEQQAAVLGLLDELGPETGLNTLCGEFPELPRAELQAIQRQYRDEWRAENRKLGYRLTWYQPGRVWAMDFAEAPVLIDDRYRYLLSVRDLASHCQLAWLPAEQATSQVVIDALITLFLEHGPPLVMKSDNGSHFIAEETRELLARWSILHLLSPPGTPQYNGSCEAAIGAAKGRTDTQATLSGRPPGCWTCDGVARALILGNQYLRPWGPRGPTPQAAWQARRDITLPERAQFRACFRERRDVLMQRHSDTSVTSLGRAALATLERVAARLALCDCGYLTLVGRSITPHIARARMTKIC